VRIDHEELCKPAWGVTYKCIISHDSLGEFHIVSYHRTAGVLPLKGQAAAGVGSIEYPSLDVND